jgi:hypothetical protein
LNEKTTINEVLKAKDKQINELINNLRANSTEEVRKYIDVAQNLSKVKLNLLQSERSEMNMKEKVE